ncbi:MULTISPECIES: sensor domain-containing diguanylate cyclase [Variovorax]|nr:MULTISPECIES: sensor domain-containing diguanylate cyclase [Variovorax]MBB3642267.1 diguanylate cyclase (GGDEF)-like protein [Variovorax sp. BK613]MDR6522343.1 diguanylate cyclase (GGDEF)-like protein [Variovorax paradoxus]
MNRAAPATFNEARRLEALESYQVLDTANEQAYDDLTSLAAAICRTPIALISLVDSGRQWFKSRVGLPVAETPRELAFCSHAILQPDHVLEVPDTLLDTRFSENALVTGDPHIRFYAGAPLVSLEGMPLGTICVIDREPRTLMDVERKALQSLARQVVAQLELRRTVAGLERQSMTDALTSLPNRRGLDSQLKSAWDDCIARQKALAVMMIDLDHFKVINDSFGHAAGDEVLAQAARVIRDHVDVAGVASRSGGEEFCVVLPGCDATRASENAEVIRRALETAAWPRRAITASFGVASCVPNASGMANVLMAQADRALYVSKHQGRNRVTVFDSWA